MVGVSKGQEFEQLSFDLPSVFGSADLTIEPGKLELGPQPESAGVSEGSRGAFFGGPFQHLDGLRQIPLLLQGRGERFRSEKDPVTDHSDAPYPLFELSDSTVHLASRKGQLSSRNLQKTRVGDGQLGCFDLGEERSCPRQKTDPCQENHRVGAQVGRPFRAARCCSSARRSFLTNATRASCS